MNYLDQTGLSYFWGKIKQHVTGSVDNAVSEVGNYTINGYKINTNPVLNKSDIGLSNVTNDAQVKRAEMGAANGVATLGSDSKIPAAQLPSYVDDVLEYDNKSAFPETGEAGKIYVAKDTNLTYRWSGSAYIEISQSLALGETSSTAYAGDKGKANRDAINSLPSTLISSVSRGTIDGDSITINVNQATKSGINYGSPAAQNFELPSATTGAAGLMSAADKTKLDGLMTGDEFESEFDKYLPLAGGTLNGELYVKASSTNENSSVYIGVDSSDQGSISMTDKNDNETIVLGVGFGLNFVNTPERGYITVDTYGDSNKFFASDGSLQTITSISNQTIDEICV